MVFYQKYSQDRFQIVMFVFSVTLPTNFSCSPLEPLARFWAMLGTQAQTCLTRQLGVRGKPEVLSLNLATKNPAQRAPEHVFYRLMEDNGILLFI